MARNSTRENIITAADRLFYERGFENSSFADVAQLVGISRGNFYYHFKTKDEILDAVIRRRIEERARMLDAWVDTSQSPKESIAQFIRILLMNEEKIRRYGCPVGSLFAELAKLNHPAEGGAREVFNLFRIWLRRRFEEMGKGQASDRLALHLLARSQGVAMLARAYPTEPFLEREAEELLAWLETVAEG
ncbi:TetR/AcrR family transcriptional regulator [Pseudothioclava arenosa]|uniref:TetR family transcriptional regulator n=1 Tax=Pseudothioclava arenosa TaxID=1795308 RepID=A0A2A4CRL7_9RHOB|nr:TetR/AcrR family transcriptional regulator [Pseudothioclava arenosa]PCD76789.1 TetR family transcriptional regulator [Pseudothioclava arenosa]